MKGWERFGALGVSLALMVGSALALERENVEGSGAFAAAGFLVLGVWIAAELHDRWGGSHRKKKKGKRDDDD